ncbi:MAG: glycosyltransferase family 2 protein [Chthoniobacterales bacterium]
MPSISLVVCVHGELEMLRRLLKESAGLYDDLVVVHDGTADDSAKESQPPAQPPAIDYAHLSPDAPLPDGYRVASPSPRPGSIHELVSLHDGRYFEGPRCHQQEPHWPFAWSQARYDWILRLDADEFPSPPLKSWLLAFRNVPPSPEEISGYTCIWPLWNGQKVVMGRWPAGRNFLFHRGRVRFFGMAEQVPVPDGQWQSVDLQLNHRPARKSYGLANILTRTQGHFWRSVISDSLLKQPTELPRWRWQSSEWPATWRRIREQSIPVGLFFLLRATLSTLRAQWRAEGKLMPLMALATPLHHFLITLQVRRKRRRRV